MATNDTTEYKSPEENTSSNNVYKNITQGVKEIFDADLHRSLPIIIIIGYIVIAFSGHLNTWVNLFQYIIFIFIACLISYIFYLIKSYPLYIVRKVRKFLNSLLIFLKNYFLVEILLIFFCLLILIKLYVLAK